MFVHICKCLHINIFAFLCVGASIQSVCALDEYVYWSYSSEHRGENKEFVVGLGCPGRLELWQLQHSEFMDVAFSCQSCRCCLRTDSRSIASER